MFNKNDEEKVLQCSLMRRINIVKITFDWKQQKNFQLSQSKARKDKHLGFIDCALSYENIYCKNDRFLMFDISCCLKLQGSLCLMKR